MLLTQSRNQHVPVFDGVRRANCSFSLSGVMILQKSRMRRRARTDLCGGRIVRIVPTATPSRFWVGKSANKPEILSLFRGLYFLTPAVKFS